MRALIYDPDAPQGLRVGEVADPRPERAQTVVEVRAVSLNFGEVADLSRRTEPGGVSGWDAAGVVVEAAADGSGPEVGRRVVTWGPAGAWAQLRAVDTAKLVTVPDTVDLGVASALPVAGVSALQALRGLGPVIGRRILVTGASGGVGRYAVQLGALAGAHVVAAVGSPERGAGLAELGAAEVVVGLDNVTEPVAGVLENVGGALLAQAYGLLADGGIVQSIGHASGGSTMIDFEAIRHLGSRLRIEAYRLDWAFGPDLAYLLQLLDQGRLDPQIGWRGPWDRVAEAAEALLQRRIRGKAVLDVT
ncbi:zinc-binding dehydrogenase [Actinomadura graeca]|uniref:Zinc-binding dehydrogenase n=1 Tax=Actinomadura graeca TaxID=2750812 RepID=A0ABX8R5M3_9ACTN|nr:zinc-binding dehydrogenase [Actinomadura graeca]QXJ25714.1 zinc-binding dehydrogenase [Actinomadura graeca]